MVTQYDQARQTPLTEPDALEQYQISAPEVLHLLHNLNHRGTVITAYFDGGRHFMLSAIIGVLRSSGLVVLDYGPDTGVAERALSAGRLICAAQIDGITVRFTLESITKAQYEGSEAIAAPIPQSAYRIQRRNLIRIKTPVDTPATCQIRQRSGATFIFPLDDISCGGFSIVDREGRFAGEVADEYSGCRLSLPGLGELSVDLQLRNRYPQPGEKGIYRYGMQFQHLSISNAILLQRYVTRLQMSARVAG